MKIGIGLPASDPESLHTWATRADAGPFSTLGLLDRLVYTNPEPLITLAALTGATSRIRVQTEVLLAPLRDPVLLAKQAATLDRLCGGRFTLGLGVGGRADDHHAAGVDIRRRGRLMDDRLATMRRIWSGAPLSDAVGPIGPAPRHPRGPEILIGAFAAPALARVARWGDGFLCAAGPSWAAPLIRTVERRWTEAGRAGRPRLVGQVNVAVGSAEVVDEARAAAAAYYGDFGHADRVVASMLTTPAGVRDTVRAYADLGMDEVMLYCWAADPDQVHRLADLTPAAG